MFKILFGSLLTIGGFALLGEALAYREQIMTLTIFFRGVGCGAALSTGLLLLLSATPAPEKRSGPRIASRLPHPYHRGRW